MYYSQCTLAIFSAWPYRLGSKVVNAHWLLTTLVVMYTLATLHSVWLTFSVDGEHLLPEMELIKLPVLVLVRLWIRAGTGILFTSKLFLCQSAILKLPGELTHHKLLRGLQADKTHRYLQTLHGQHGGESFDQVDQSEIPSRTVATLHSVLTWLSMATSVFAVFLPVVLYTTSGLTYDEGVLPVAPDFTFWLSIWELVSFLLTLMIVGQVFAFFVYEQRLRHYAATLVAQGDEEVKESAQDIREKLAVRWSWLENYTFGTIALLAVAVMIHRYLDLPLSNSCMPFAEKFTSEKWFYCILLLSLAAMLTFMNIEDWLRVGKRAVCFICPCIMVVIQGSFFRDLLEVERHLHLLLYLIPFIVLLWISWTFFWAHFADSKLPGPRSQRHAILCTVHALLMVVSMLCIITSTYSEFSYLSSNRTLNLSCSNLQTSLSNPTDATLEAPITDKDCHHLKTLPTDDPNNPNLGPLMATPSLPKMCYFIRGRYSVDLRITQQHSHTVTVDISYHAQLYRPDTVKVKCMFPTRGHYAVTFYSPEPFDYSSTDIFVSHLSQCTQSIDISLEGCHSWRLFFTLVYRKYVINLKPKG